MERATVRDRTGRDERAGDWAGRLMTRMMGPGPDLAERDEAVLRPERWAAEALVALWEANRSEGEAYEECFARLGVPRYTSLLERVMNAAA